MSAGGKRPNAGRKKGSKTVRSLSMEAARNKIVNFVNESLEPLLEAQRDSALGHWKAELKDGKEKIYLVSPNFQAIEGMLSRAYGKPKESIEHSGEIKVKELILDV